MFLCCPVFSSSSVLCCISVCALTSLVCGCADFSCLKSRSLYSFSRLVGFRCESVLYGGGHPVVQFAFASQFLRSDLPLLFSRMLVEFEIFMLFSASRQIVSVWEEEDEYQGEDDEENWKERKTEKRKFNGKMRHDGKNQCEEEEGQRDEISLKKEEEGLRCQVGSKHREQLWKRRWEWQQVDQKIWSHERKWRRWTVKCTDQRWKKCSEAWSNWNNAKRSIKVKGLYHRRQWVFDWLLARTNLLLQLPGSLSELVGGIQLQHELNICFYSAPVQS